MAVKAKAPKKPSPEEYAKFIEGLEFLDVRLVDSRVSSSASRYQADELDVQTTLGGDIRIIKGTDSEFEALPTIEVHVSHSGTEEEIGTIEATFGLHYRCNIRPTKGHLEVFRNLNVPLNAWPYIREYVQQTSTRFGWSPLILPALKSFSREAEKEKQRPTT